jgi:hypothetical protein
MAEGPRLSATGARGRPRCTRRTRAGGAPPPRPPARGSTPYQSQLKMLSRVTARRRRRRRQEMEALLRTSGAALMQPFAPQPAPLVAARGERCGLEVITAWGRRRAGGRRPELRPLGRGAPGVPAHRGAEGEGARRRAVAAGAGRLIQPHAAWVSRNVVLNKRRAGRAGARALSGGRAGGRAGDPAADGPGGQHGRHQPQGPA